MEIASGRINLEEAENGSQGTAIVNADLPSREVLTNSVGVKALCYRRFCSEVN